MIAIRRASVGSAQGGQRPFRPAAIRLHTSSMRCFVLEVAVEKELTAALGRMPYGQERPMPGMVEIRAMLGPLDRTWRSTR
jgi:hypothetical protein